jgi:hypothetical protein
MLMAYAGPETILPLSSAAAIILGVVLAYWTRLLKFFRWVVSAGLGLILPGKSVRSGRDISTESTQKNTTARSSA